MATIPKELPTEATSKVDSDPLVTEWGPDVEDECVICMSEKSNCLGYLVCTHSFCFTCIQNWSKTENTCPLCKVKFNHIDKKHKAPLTVPVELGPDGKPKKKRGRPRKPPQ